MKRGCFCDIVNVNKESKGERTLPWGTPQDIILHEDLNAPILVHYDQSYVSRQSSSRQ